MKKCITLIVVLFFIFIGKAYTQHPPAFDEHIAFALQKIRERPVGLSEERAHVLYLDSEKSDTLLTLSSLNFEKRWIPFTGTWYLSTEKRIVSFDGNTWREQNLISYSLNGMQALRNIFSIAVLLPLLWILFERTLRSFFAATIIVHLIILGMTIGGLKTPFYIAVTMWQVSVTVCGLCILGLKNLVQKR